MNKIEEIVKGAGLEIEEGKIDLGVANGWSRLTSEAFFLLKDYKVIDSGKSRNISNCYNEYSFSVACVGKNKEVCVYEVVHKVDSGD